MSIFDTTSAELEYLMRLRHATVVVLAASALVLGACGNDDKDSSSSDKSSTSTSQSSSRSASSTSAAASDDEALATYAGTLCGIQTGFVQDLTDLTAKLDDPATGPDQAASIISDLATSFGGAGLALVDLGDPPNGEGAGLTEAANEAFSTAAEGLEGVAGQIRDGSLTDPESTNAALTPIITTWQDALTALDTEYPAPSIDALQESIPGCSNS